MCLVSQHAKKEKTKIREYLRFVNAISAAIIHNQTYDRLRYGFLLSPVMPSNEMQS